MTGAENGATSSRVCVIGSSYVGAVYKAYKDADPVADMSFSFFATGGTNYGRLSIEDGRIVNAQVASQGMGVVSDYGYFVIYGDFPTPYEYITFEDTLALHPFSQQARDVALRDWTLQCRSASLVRSLRKCTEKPIFVLSRNFHLDERCVGTRAERERGAACIARIIAPEQYVETPEELFTSDDRPNPQYYQGSISLQGHTETSDRSNHHFNAAGGALVLASIVASIRAVNEPRS